ncbi:hypothetical protein EYF80_060434 [Liparis tanakae]|uniref:Uncharacterized protein n=1 Tax=Liparis tanakae TaxID=230148 RepID=A0A4Z2EKF0_9TELE|nr:hypothetical protein EYF80_060434 [Liparis tanakae]
MMPCVRLVKGTTYKKKGKGGASTRCSRCVRTGASRTRRRLAPERLPPTVSRWRLVLNESGVGLVPFLEQLVAEHPANERRGKPAEQAGQQHGAARRLGHRRRLHQELQLPVFSRFLRRERKKKKKKKEEGVRVKAGEPGA